MTSIGNAAFDLAVERSEQERETGVARIRAAVSSGGSFACRDCSLPIDDQRRKAAPFAERCIDCQRIHENASRRKCA